MKKLIFLFLMIAAGFGASAQKYTEIKVSQLPQATRDYLTQNMPGADITKAVQIDNKGTLYYGVVFENRGRKRVLIFDKDGNFYQKGDNLNVQPKPETPPVQSAKGTSETDPPEKESPTVKNPANPNLQPIPPRNLPAVVTDYLQTNFPEGRITACNELKQSEIIFYQVTVNEGLKEHIVTFNSKGNYLSKRTYTVPSGEKKPAPTPDRNANTSSPSQGNTKTPSSTGKAPAQQPSSQPAKQQASEATQPVKK